MQVKFLIVRFSSIGDIVLTTPIIRCLKQQIEDAKVHFFTKPQYVDILKFNPYIDKILILKNFKESIAEIKMENYDYIIDLHNNLRSFRFKNKLKILDFSFPKLNWEKWLMVNFKINKLPNVHVVDRYFETVKLFDVNNDNQGLDFFINPENEISLESIKTNFKEDFVVFAIGGQHYTKRMPAEMLAKICEALNFPIILLGDEKDFENGEIIKKNSENIFNLCGKLNLLQSASIIKRAKLIVTHDTGLMHIAAAYQRVIFSIWGNTIPEFGMEPYISKKKSFKTQRLGIKCRPCSKIGFKKCPKKHFNCMRLQNIEDLINGIKENYEKKDL